MDSLRKHAFSNILKLLQPKKENFQIKNFDIFHIPAQNIDSNEYQQSMFLSRNKKNNVYPCNPNIYYIKVGFKGVKIIYACFRDDTKNDDSLTKQRVSVLIPVSFFNCFQRATSHSRITVLLNQQPTASVVVASLCVCANNMTSPAYSFSLFLLSCGGCFHRIGADQTPLPDLTLIYKVLCVIITFSSIFHALWQVVRS